MFYEFIVIEDPYLYVLCFRYRSILRHVRFMASDNSCDLLNTSKSRHFQAVSNGVSQDHVIASTLAPVGNVAPAKCCPRRGNHLYF